MEFVSAETVQEIILWVYKLALRYQYFIQDLVTFEDVKFTVKFLLSAITLLLISFTVSDAVFLMVLTNAIIAWPLVYEKKRVEIDRVLGLINLKLDEIIMKMPLVADIDEAKRQQQSSADSKKNK